MTSSVPLLEKDQIVVGKPLPFSIYSVDRKLLLAAGRIVETERSREMLVKNGIYRSNEDAELERDGYSGDAQAVNTPLSLLRKDFGDVHSTHRFAITMAPNETHEAYNAFVLGVHEQSMILTAPVRPDGSLVAVTPGQTWLCRTFQVTSAFRFRSTVLKAAFEPFPHLHLEIPRHVERRKVRGGPRANVFVQGRIEGPVNAPCVVVDVGVGGCRIAVDAGVRMERGQSLKLAVKIELVSYKFELLLDSTIVGAFGATDARHPQVAFYGLKFEPLRELESLVLHGLVTGHLAAELNSLWQVLQSASPLNAESRSST